MVKFLPFHVERFGRQFQSDLLESPNLNQLSDSEIEELIARVRRPAAAMVLTQKQTDSGDPGCWMGGEPTLPPEIEWPHFQETNLNLDVPMHFLAQVNLARLPKADYGSTIPKYGTLFVFSDPIFAPLYQLGRSTPAMQAGLGARVIFVPEEVDQYPFRAAPDSPEALKSNLDLAPLCNYVSSGYREMVERNIRSASGLHKWPFRFVTIDTNPMDHPSFEGNEMNGQAAKWVDDAIFKISNDFGSSAGLIGYIAGAPAYDIIRHSQYRKSDPDHSHWPVLSDDHIMLMQLASSEYTGFCHAEFRDLSFWITKTELEKEKFDNVVVWEML